MAWTPDRVSAPASISYTPEAPWDDGANCTGTFTPGALRLANYLARTFRFIHAIYGYNCRQNTKNPRSTSVHGLGRAIDIGIRQWPDGSADRRGDEIAQWLIDHAHELGVQVIIWDRTIWSVSRNGTGSVRPYDGPNSHRDHLHVELNAQGAAAATPWFQSNQDGYSAFGIIAGLLITASAGVGLYYGWRWFQRQREDMLLDSGA